MLLYSIRISQLSNINAVLTTGIFTINEYINNNNTVKSYYKEILQTSEINSLHETCCIKISQFSKIYLFVYSQQDPHYFDINLQMKLFLFHYRKIKIFIRSNIMYSNHKRYSGNFFTCTIFTLYFLLIHYSSRLIVRLFLEKVCLFLPQQHNCSGQS